MRDWALPDTASGLAMYLRKPPPRLQGTARRQSSSPQFVRNRKIWPNEDLESSTKEKRSSVCRGAFLFWGRFETFFRPYLSIAAANYELKLGGALGPVDISRSTEFEFVFRPQSNVMATGRR